MPIKWVRWAFQPEEAWFNVEDEGLESELGITSLEDKHLPASCRAGSLAEALPSVP